MLGRADKASGGAVGNLLKEAAKKGTEGAVIDAIQQIGQRAIGLDAVSSDEVAAAFTAEAMMELAVSLVGRL